MTTRRTFLSYSGLALGSSLLPGQQWLLNHLFPVAGEMRLLRNNVGIYLERGGSIGWMMDKEGAVVIDTQFPEQAGNFIAQMQTKTDRKVDILFNTHHHGDHSSGNIAFKGLADRLVAHTRSKANQEAAAAAQNTLDKQWLPDTVFEENWSSKVGSETVTARYFGPGHTNGDSVVHFENANVAHLGDLCFNRRFPYIDKKSGASIQNWILVLQQIRATFDSDTLFVFGHGKTNDMVTGGKEDLMAFENYLEQLLVYVRKGIAEGKTAEQLSEVPFIPNAPEWTGDGIRRSIDAALIELAEN
ncbi:MAG: MBL fold metallo-hydrolase [Saprospiraceae bacterium]|nr:MBL fold metallo-hydrolase [Saprospiraceae bacterium]MDP4820851.1 MBL fold metallo-hydrolase [Saprospiraceae bacterium]MDP5000102.1 MBL fold metallo-hydrolase [Saprospiraceae bacterium]